MLSLTSSHRARRIAVRINARRPLDRRGTIFETRRVDAQRPLERAAADHAAEAGHKVVIDTELERLAP